jgi:ribokinase
MSRAGGGARRVVCLGDVMVDVVARLPGPLEPGSDRPSPIHLRGGGSAANTASWLAHAGVATTLIGRVGNDVFGAWSREQLGGVATGMSSDAHLPTGTCIVLVAPDGERTMVPDAGANAGLRPEHVDPTWFAAGGHLHLSGYAVFGAARDAALHALTLARAAGMTISVGAASAAPLRELGPDAFIELIGADLLLVANRDEAAVLTGRADARSAARQLADRLGRAVVTGGAGTAVWCEDGDELVEEPATVVDEADTTGAGDAFAAGVIGALIEGLTPAAAMRAGHALAAEACRQSGGRPAGPEAEG